MAKKIKAYIKLQVPAGQANPAPPVGPALGQHGVNIMEFCKTFNAATQSAEAGLPTPVVITCSRIRASRSSPQDPARRGVLLRKAAGIEKGSGEPNVAKVGRVDRGALAEIAKVKMSDLNTEDLDAAIRIVAGTARSMGIETEGVE